MKTFDQLLFVGGFVVGLLYFTMNWNPTNYNALGASVLIILLSGRLAAHLSKKDQSSS